MAIRTGSLSKGISLALFLAGPIFFTMLGVYEVASRFPQAIILPGLKIAVVLPMIMLLAAVFGAFVSLPANLIGGLAMGALSERYSWLRPPLVWTLAGMLLGVLIAATCAHGSPQAAFALIATSAICASICRHWVCWDDDPLDRRPIIDRWAKFPE